MNAGFIVLFFHDDFCSFTDEKGPFFDEKTMSFLICFLLLKISFKNVQKRDYKADLMHFLCYNFNA